jgi:serine/threonine protein kinase
VLNNEPAFPQTDIWSVGVVMYILLSGVSPFRGTDSEETRQNVTFVRYRFEYLYKELSQEATRFLILVFKRAPGYVALYNLCSIVLILVSSTSRTLLCKKKPGKVYNLVTISVYKGTPKLLVGLF